MSNSNPSHPSNPVSPVPVDPYADPVAFLAAHGIEAELVAVITHLPEAA